VARYIDILADLMLVRRLPAWHGNVGKRLVRAPKVYVRDSGIVHALLGLTSLEAVLGHPVAGVSWEGFVIEQLLAAAPQAEASFYRTSHGAEADLVLGFRNGETWVVEIKLASAPTVSRGFHPHGIEGFPSGRRRRGGHPQTAGRAGSGALSDAGWRRRNESARRRRASGGATVNGPAQP